MPRRALADTNIILDAAMPERPDHAYALMLLDEVAYGELNLAVAATSLKDVYYVLSKYSDEPSARQYVNSMMDAFEILSVDSAICRAASANNEPDFEDGIVRACAEMASVDLIITRDKSAFERSTVRSMSARRYIELFCDIQEANLDEQ